MSGENANNQTTHPEGATNIQMTQNGLLIWSDTNIHLRDAVNNINTLISDERCVQFLQEVGDKKACMIISGSVGQQIVAHLQNLPQINSILIFCNKEGYPAKWIKDWTKINGVFTTNDYSNGTHHQNAIPITTADGGDTSSTSTQIINPEQHGLLHGMVNLMKKLGFFTEDLYYNIDQLLSISGDQMALHNFIFTSKDRSTSLDFMRHALKNIEVMNGFFAIVIDPTRFTTSLTPFLHLEHFGGRGGGVNETVPVPIDYPTEETILSNLQRELEANLQLPSPDHLALAQCYNNIGLLCKNMGDFTKALQSFGTAGLIYRQSLPSSHPALASALDNIGSVYSSKGDYHKALAVYQQTLAMRIQTLPLIHPDVATSYKNIGLIYSSMGDHAKALWHYKKHLTIQQQLSSPIHMVLAESYNHIGSTYYHMNDYPKALLFHEQALAIREQLLPPTHSDLTVSYNNIGVLCRNMGDFSKALQSFGKVGLIYRQTLPSTHPLVVSALENIGSVYFSKGDYLKALSLYQKTLTIRQFLLPVTHPHLATCYINIALVYLNMNDYRKAFLSYEKALFIQTSLLPPVPDDVATTYSEMGSLHAKMGNHWKAHSYYEYAVNLVRCSLPTNDTQLQKWRYELDRLKRTL